MPVPPIQELRAFLLGELRKDRSFLLPLRLFLGLGWLRAGVEKLLDAGWYDGTELTAFLTSQLAWSQEAFPLYGAVMSNVLLPLATPVGIVVIALQLLAGLAIVIGYRTAPALLVGVVLNVNFVLAGVPDPSAFYIVIQLVLFAGSAGTVLGVDALRLSRDDAAALLTGVRPRPDAARRRLYVVLAIASVAFSAAVAPSVTSLSPATVVEDPAMILVVLGLFAASVAGLGALGGPRDATTQDRGTGRATTARRTPAGIPLR